MPMIKISNLVTSSHHNVRSYACHDYYHGVPGTCAVFNVDGHHKLIQWKMVTHAAIDSYSRLVVFMKCSNNNKATTVYANFLKAVELYGLPSRVRSDQGRENCLVAWHMLEYQGLSRGSMLTGSSVHNQRIERLWRDMHESVTKLFYRWFYFMEDQRILDPTNDSHIIICTAFYIHSQNK